MADQRISRGERRTRATMKDVAQLAGVGVKTVSRVVNGEVYVADHTREAVERAIAQLGFQRNLSAVSLRSGNSHTVGLIVHDLAEPFQAALVQSIETALFDSGMLLFTASSEGDIEREHAIAQQLITRRVDGLILLPAGQDYRYLYPEHEAGLSVVFVDRAPDGIQADLVVSDNVAGARAGTEYLIEKGHRRIAFIGDPESVFAGRERLRGYSEALGDAGLPVDRRLLELGDAAVPDVNDALVRFSELPEPPTAIFTGNSWHTLAALRSSAFEELGLDHVAFDDLEFHDLLRRPLTAVAQRPDRFGESTAAILLRRIAGDSSAPQVTRIPTELRVRA